MRSADTAGWARLAKALRGHYIALEGADGAGKTTAARWLESQLRAHLPESDVVLVREPGGTDVGEKIRDILLRSGGEMFMWTELLLFFAARAELYYRVVRPALDEERVVITDRCVFSTVAYQSGKNIMALRSRDGAKNQIEPEAVLNLAEMALPPVSLLEDAPVPYPHVTLLLDIDLPTMRARPKTRLDRIESRNDEYHQSVIDGYRKVAANPYVGSTVVTIDATQPEAAVRDAIYTVLYDRFVAGG